MEVAKKGETRLEYRAFDGFYLYVDFVLNIPRKFERVYVTYQLVLPSSEEQFPEVKTQVRPVEYNSVRTYKLAVAEKHRFFGAPPDDGAYILFKFWVEENFIKYDPHEFDDLLNIEEDEANDKPLLEEKRFVVYGWAPFKVFYKKKVM